MTKIFKKIAAIAMATAMTATMAVSANAVYEQKTFKVVYVNSPNYIPGDVNSGTSVRLVASADTYTGIVTDMTELANRSVTIDCTTHEIINTYSDLVFNTPNVSRSWEISGDISKNRSVYYKVTAYTNVYGTLNATGKITRG